MGGGESCGMIPRMRSVLDLGVVWKHGLVCDAGWIT